MRESALALDDAALRELAAFHHACEVDSTQDWALSRPAAARGATVFVADRQHAGRGRRGRTWHTDPDGALAFTVARAFALAPRELAPLGLVVGIALAQALRALGVPRVGLKWPNDLVVEDAKLGGILIEAQGGTVAIGVGLNLALGAAPGIDQAWTDLTRAGAGGRGRVEVLSALLNALLPALDRFEREGFGTFREAWPAFDVLAGREVRVSMGAVVAEGEALGIDADGGLRVRHADGERVHHGGEVSVRVAA